MRMKSKRKRIILSNIFLFALLFGLIAFNKKVLRSNFSDSQFINNLTGCFPNFIAAYLISFAFINAVLTKNPRHKRLIAYLSSVFVFFILAMEEIKPMWGASEYFDPLDLIASGIGSVLAILSFELILFIRTQKSVRTSQKHDA